MTNIISSAWTLVWMAIWGALAAEILPNMFISWITEVFGLAILLTFGVLTEFIIQAPKLRRLAPSHVSSYIT